MAAGLAAVPLVMDQHYRSTMGDAYATVVGDDRAVRGNGERGRGGGGRGGGGRGTRGRGGVVRGGRGRGAGRGAGLPQGARGSAGDMVGRYPGKYTDSVTATGEKICMRWNRGVCEK